MDLFRAQDAATRQALNSIATGDGYQNAISRLGLGQDNAISAGTYNFYLVTRNRLLLEMSYRGSWIVGQVIDCVAEDMTREGITPTTSEGEQNLAEFTAAMTRLSIWDSLCDGTKWGRLYGGAIAVMQIEGQDLATPLNISTVGLGQFKGLAVYDRWMLNPVMTPLISSGPDIGLPMYYQIVSDQQSYDPTHPNATADGILVHHSRVFRFPGIKLPFYQAITENLWDESVLERLWDRLIAFDNATMSAASLVDRAQLRMVGIQGLREIIAAGGEALDGLRASFDFMRMAQVNEGLTLIDAEDKYETNSYSFAGLSDVLLQFGQQLAGASQIPLVRLFGQSPAGLNATGESDIRQYYDGIKSKQERTFRKPLTTLLRVLWRSEFGKPAPRDLEFTFNALWQSSDLEKADVGAKNTDSICKAFNEGLLPRAAAMKDLRAQAKVTGLFGNITDEDITEAEMEPAPLPDADPGPGKEITPGKEGEKPEGVREPLRLEPGKTGDSKLGFWKWFRW